jgi:hypothetical protein
MAVSNVVVGSNVRFRGATTFPLCNAENIRISILKIGVNLKETDLECELDAEHFFISQSVGLADRHLLKGSKTRAPQIKAPQKARLWSKLFDVTPALSSVSKTVFKDPGQTQPMMTFSYSFVDRLLNP